MPAQQNRPSSHATSSSSGGWNSRRVAVSALFCALAIVASFIEIPLFPPAPYLKYDPSGIVGLVAGLAFGPAVGSAVDNVQDASQLQMPVTLPITMGNASQDPASVHRKATIAMISVTATTSTARTAAVRTGSGRRRRRAGSSTHNGR